MPSWTTMNDLTTGDLVTEADMDALRGNIEYLLSPNTAQVLRDSGDLTTTSTAFVDAAGLSLALVTHGGPVLVIFSGTIRSSGGVTIYLDLDVNGTRQGGTKGLVYDYLPTSGSRTNAAFALLLTGLAAGTHTIALQWCVSGGTGTLDASSSAPAQLSAIEL